MKCSIWGDTSSGQTQASLPRVMALFSMSDLLIPCSSIIKKSNKKITYKNSPRYTCLMHVSTYTRKWYKICSHMHIVHTFTSACWSIGTKHEIAVITIGETSWRTWNLVKVQTIVKTFIVTSLQCQCGCVHPPTPFSGFTKCKEHAALSYILHLKWGSGEWHYCTFQNTKIRNWYKGLLIYIHLYHDTTSMYHTRNEPFI